MRTNRIVRVKIIELFCSIIILLPISFVSATTTILDNYIGGTASNNSWAGKDVIGSSDIFDISQMTVDIKNNSLAVSIFSTYFSKVGSYGTRLGDLFISTDGWSPNGIAGYLKDDFNNGEFMELAAVLSDHGDQIDKNKSQNYIGKSGELSIYQVKKEQVVLSNSEPGYIYREGQEVRYNVDSAEQKFLTGTWSIEDVLGSNYDKLIYSFSFPDNYLKGSVLGFHWAMTCGNDTIEGSAQVPEPGSVLLLTCAAVGLIMKKRAVSFEN